MRSGPTPALSFVTSDDVELFARSWPASSRPRAAIVIAHGFTATADDAALVEVAEALNARDLDVTAYDARGHGRSGGVCTLGDLEQHDVAAAVAAARRRADRIVLVGASMGAIAVLRYAASDPTLAGVVTLSCPARWTLPRNARAVTAALLTRTRAGRAVTARYLGVTVAPAWTSPEPPVALAEQVRAPLAVVHGAVDRFIPSAAAHELHAAAAGPRRVVIVPELGHAFGPAATGPIVEAVEWALSQPPTPEVASFRPS